MQVVANFSHYLGMQYTRSAGFREELKTLDNEYFKSLYGALTDEGIRRHLRRRGAEPTDEAVASSRRLFDALKDGSVTIHAQDAALAARAAELALEVGEQFVRRPWVV